MHMPNRISLPHLPWAASKSRKIGKRRNKRKGISEMPRHFTNTRWVGGKKGRKINWKILSYFPQAKKFLSMYYLAQSLRSVTERIWRTLTYDSLKKERWRTEHTLNSITNNHEMCPISLVNKEMQLIITMRYHFTLSRLLKTFHVYLAVEQQGLSNIVGVSVNFWS